MKTESNFANFLRTQGYSERAVKEICKWYVCSTTKTFSDKLPVDLKH